MRPRFRESQPEFSAKPCQTRGLARGSSLAAAVPCTRANQLVAPLPLLLLPNRKSLCEDSIILQNTVNSPSLLRRRFRSPWNEIGHLFNLSGLLRIESRARDEPRASELTKRTAAATIRWSVRRRRYVRVHRRRTLTIGLCDGVVCG